MKVLILTIQDDPPSLESYDDDDGDSEILGYAPVDEVYSTSFRALVAQLLQKDPTRRPACHDLLHQNTSLMCMNDVSALQTRREAMQRNVCDIVRDVGPTEESYAEAEGEEGTEDISSSATAPRGNHRLGHTPVSVSLTQEKGRPPGTSWIFADGSQVLSSTAMASTVDDVMELLDEFGKQTGGENYTREDDVNPSELSAVIEAMEEVELKDSTDSQSDDLEVFMTAFEQSTAGENFRRPNEAHNLE
jgi:serine/threonine protein kinase